MRNCIENTKACSLDLAVEDLRLRKLYSGNNSKISNEKVLDEIFARFVLENNFWLNLFENPFSLFFSTSSELKTFPFMEIQMPGSRVWRN